MIADLHSHYPMHVVPSAPKEADTLDAIVAARERLRIRDRFRARVVALASRFANYRDFFSGPRVTIPLLREGGVGVALSVLYSPFDELDLKRPYGSPPGRDYFADLIRQLEAVEEELAGHPDAEAVHDPAQLDAALGAGRVALVHCVEGGFHLGASEVEVERNVGELARRGVAYITLAHLFWRRVATDANALPFLPDWAYALLFPQPRIGLGELGQAAVRAMVDERVLVDISHMTRRGRDETLTLLERLDPSREVPVIASHAAYRFGGQHYNLGTRAIERIAERDGVVGLILAEHQTTDGLRRRRTQTLDDSLEVLFAHLDRLREITGSHRHAAIGSDLDGFIKPTLAGLDDASRLAELERGLVNRYGPEDAELIASGNVLRLLRRPR
jgi:microsomal dipeptidase-like Zn-dependent dipeptidase